MSILAPGHRVLQAVLAICFFLLTANQAGGFPSQARNDSVICYHEASGFLVSPPPGWSNRQEIASAYGICAMYAPKEYSFDSAPAVLYPKATSSLGGQNLQDSARLQAMHSQEYISAKWENDGPFLVEGQLVDTADGKQMAVWLFNGGPQGNEWEAAAYLPIDNSILMLVLSARTEAGRDDHLAALYQAASQVQTLKVDGLLPAPEE